VLEGDVTTIEIRVRGRVQGVGFRPTVWRFARELGITGEVLNDSEGVLIRAGGTPGLLATFIARVEHDPPPLARVDGIETRAYVGELSAEFRIGASACGAMRTQIAPDAAMCAACSVEVADSVERRYRYPFTTCTHCGPRLTIVTGSPYDRAATTLAAFPLCPLCAAEYADPASRRFHAESTACHGCGPGVRLVRLDGRAINPDRLAVDDVDAVARLLRNGEIVAIKGLGGYHLACDATQPDSVARLRAAKHRDAKPFALMASSLDVIRRYCEVGEQEADALNSPEGPIVLLRTTDLGRRLGAVAPGLATLGFMLSTTPLHYLIVRELDRPVVMTSGNRSDEPQATTDGDAALRLAAIAPYALVHDRPIANRVDDSVVRLSDGKIRLLRRARGYAPAPISLPPGFEAAPPILAYGGDLKAAFCLTSRGEAILSQHQGDLHNPATLDDYRKNLALYAHLFEHVPAAVAVDRHPEYRGAALARDTALPCIEVQHHHAHIASCLVEHGRPRTAPPVLGVVLDGVGLGDDGTVWGGEFLLASYERAERVGALKPVRMLGGDRASVEPWRNLYAHLVAAMGWSTFADHFAALPLFEQLAGKPLELLEHMLAAGTHAPLASSCGRLFDAVAAAVGICFERQLYEGEAAMRLEAAIDLEALTEDERLAYRFTIAHMSGSGLPYLEPLAMWWSLLNDRIRGTRVGVIAARFHRGLARGLVQLACELAAATVRPRFDTIALSGGCFQNRVLLEQCAHHLRAAGFTVLAHEDVPANDGGLSLGQAAIAAAQLLNIGGSSCA
jgi:hydrogenase maturation protein HypF